MQMLAPPKTHAQGIEIASGGSITVTGAATISINNGGIINNGTFTKGSETITLSGTAAGSISGSNALTVNNLTVSSTGVISLNNNVNAATMVINPNAKVTNSAGKSLTGSTMVLKSDATGTGTYVDNGSATTFSSTTAEQFLTGSGGSTPNNRFWYLSSPMTGATASGFAVGTGSKLWYYDQPTHAYATMTGSESLEVGKGYVSRVGSNRTVSLTGGSATLNNGDVTVTLSRQSDSNSKNGYNLIGNPYPSFVTLNYVVDGENSGIESSIWYRSVLANNSGMAFDTYNILTNTSVGVQSGSGALTPYIAPMQAFWVRANYNLATVTFRQANRSHQAAVKLRSQAVENPELRLSVTNGIVSDETVIGFYPNASDAFDPYDSHKMSNERIDLPELFSYAGTEEVAINGLPALVENKEIRLGFRTGLSGTFTIKANELIHLDEGVNVFLMDKWTNTTQNLNASPSYSFTSDAGTLTDRFSLVVAKTATQLGETVLKPSFEAYTDGKGLINVQLNHADLRNARLNVYAVSGQLLMTKPVTESTFSFEPKLAGGIYLIEVTQAGFTARKKIIINQ